MSKEKPIWQKNRVELFQGLFQFEAGLTDEEAKKRLEQYGPNELQEGKRKSVLRIFWNSLRTLQLLSLLLPLLYPVLPAVWRAPLLLWWSSP